MVAKILIKRRFVEGKTEQIVSLLKRVRSAAMNQPGYISGETLSQKAYPENMAVICTWQTMEDWHAWKNSSERQEYEEMLALYQTRRTEYEEYELGPSFHT